MVNQVDLKSKSAHTIKFDTYDLQLDLKDAVSGMKARKKKNGEMTLSELVAVSIKRRKKISDTFRRNGIP